VSRRRHLALVAALVTGIAASVGALAARGGEPADGALLWQEQQCGTCHTLARAGSTGTAGPNVDRWLAPHAKRAGLPVDRFALSRVTWGGRGMPAYGPQLTSEQVDDLVSFVLGRSFTAQAGGVPRVRGFDPPPRTVTAGRATVARWVKAKRLRGSAAAGARVFAREGCLSCHRYLGSGARRLRAPDLTAIGRTRRAAFLERYVARPYRFGNTRMPTYADLGADNLRRVAAFLAASR
jgi:mono/diheme cytochrome c family protein